MSIRITCINKPDRNSPHEAIRCYGWTEDATEKNGVTERQIVVGWVKNGVVAYVQDNLGNRANCRVNRSVAGTEFLQTYADGKFTDNLLSLVECR